jgi:hypothetical protein
MMQAHHPYHHARRSTAHMLFPPMVFVTAWNNPNGTYQLKVLGKGFLTPVCLVVWTLLPWRSHTLNFCLFVCYQLKTGVHFKLTTLNTMLAEAQHIQLAISLPHVTGTSLRSSIGYYGKQITDCRCQFGITSIGMKCAHHLTVVPASQSHDMCSSVIPNRLLSGGSCSVLAGAGGI